MKKITLNRLYNPLPFFRSGMPSFGRAQFYETRPKTGQEFVVLIRRKEDYVLGGRFDFSVEKFFEIMTPNSLTWKKLSMDSKQWNIEVGSDKVNYHWSSVGIQMSFSNDTTFRKALRIAKEVSRNLEKHTGFKAALEIHPKPSLQDPHHSF